MKMCMIGSRGHYPLALHRLPQLPQVSLVGVSAGTHEDSIDPLKHAIERLTRQPMPPAFADYRDMLEQVKPDIVTIAGPFEAHASMSMDAMRCGADVFCEKPVATSLQDLDALKSVQAETGRLFLSMMSTRYSPVFQAGWLAFRRGAIGAVRLIDTRKSYKLGNRPAYYHRRETYGGTIPWVGSHAIDWIQWFCGPDKPFQRVYASHSTCGDHGVGDMELTATCQFQLAGDTLAACSIDVLRPSSAPSHSDDRLRLVGESGVLEIQGDTCRLINAEQDGVQLLEAAEDADLFEDFIAQREGRGTCRLQTQDVFAVTEAVLRARLSADEGVVVSFD